MGSEGAEHSGRTAGVISSIMVTLGAGQQDSMLRMLSLKAWMKARGLKKVCTQTAVCSQI
jgi:hypothetical protein